MEDASAAGDGRSAPSSVQPATNPSILLLLAVSGCKQNSTHPVTY